MIIAPLNIEESGPGVDLTSQPDSEQYLETI